MSIKLQNKVALITGGAAGLGYQFAKIFLKNGAKGVTIVDIEEDAGREAIKDLSDEFNPNFVLFVKANVTKKDELKVAFQKTIENFKQLDIVVNNAGIVNEENWEYAIATNCNGVVNGTILAIDEYLPKFKSGGEGIVVNMASLAAIKPPHNIPVYSGTKGLVLSFSRAISKASATRKNKIRILIICPGLTETGILYKTEEFIDAIKNLEKQSPQHVAEELIKVIENGENGTAWIIEKENPAECVKFYPYK